MDMREGLGGWLTGATVHAMGDRYEGAIAEIVEKEVRNKWKRKTTLERVIVFTDGMELVLTRSMQFELMDRFGCESDNWVGNQIVLGSRSVERTDARSGERLVSWEKVLLPRESASRAQDAREPAWVAEQESDTSDPVGAHDEDDIDFSARRFARRRSG